MRARGPGRSSHFACAQPRPAVRDADQHRLRDRDGLLLSLERSTARADPVRGHPDTLIGAGRLQYEAPATCGRSAGETMLVVIPHPHQYWIEDGERWEFFWLAMTGREALRLHRAILAAAGPVFRLRPETVARLAQISLDLRDGKAKGAGEASAIAYAATMALYDDVLGRRRRSPARRATLDRSRARLCPRHLHEPLEVQTLADLAGLSRAHFSRVFTRLRGRLAGRICPHRAHAARREPARQRCGSRQAGVSRLRLRRSELFRQGVSQELRRKPDRVSHHRHVR